jgi:hypothetical protein
MHDGWLIGVRKWLKEKGWKKKYFFFLVIIASLFEIRHVELGFDLLCRRDNCRHFRFYRHSCRSGGDRQNPLFHLPSVVRGFFGGGMDPTAQGMKNDNLVVLH